jgi:hypothetical protein
LNIFNNLLFQYYIGKLKKEMEGIKNLVEKIEKRKSKIYWRKNEERGNKEKNS